VSDLETAGKNLDNSARLPLTGWKLWWRIFIQPGTGYYKDRAFPACPVCGSPNVRLRALRVGQSYQCLEKDCKSKGSCEVEGSDGVERRKARVRVYVYIAAFVVLIIVLGITHNLPDAG